MESIMLSRIPVFRSIAAMALVGTVVLATYSTVGAKPAPVAPVAADDIVAVEDSMHEFMEYVFQPTYLRLKQSMATAPADNKGWKAIKSDSLILAESCNLLYSRKPKEKAEDWVKHATASKDNGAKLYNAAKAKDFTAATDAYKAMLESCNACHRQFEDGKHILAP
jgi:hypothetical protein